jgi:hypothetical protein
METLTEWALEIRKFFNCDECIWIPHGIIFGVGMAPGVNCDDLRDRPELRPYNGKNQQSRAKCDETDRDQATAPFLLYHFGASFLAFALPLLIHENSLMKIILNSLLVVQRVKEKILNSYSVTHVNM